MREIKFRAWYGGRMCDVGRIDFFEHANPTVNDELVGAELMQFTGLKDKNGREIYEGDICLQNTQLLQVRFRFGCFFLCEDGDRSVVMDPHAVDFHAAHRQHKEHGRKVFSELEVIGNIYENPNLLTDHE